jgi:hypothetical protein
MLFHARFSPKANDTTFGGLAADNYVGTENRQTPSFFITMMRLAHGTHPVAVPSE